MYQDVGLYLEVQNMADGFGAAYPIERYSNYTAFHMGSSIEEVKAAKKRKEIANNIYMNGKNATINITYIDDMRFIIKRSDKNKTIYYNRVPYNEFDLVINADFTEARIQIYYTLKVRHTVISMEKHEKQKEAEVNRLEREQAPKVRKKRLFR